MVGVGIAPTSSLFRSDANLSQLPDHNDCGLRNSDCGLFKTGRLAEGETGRRLTTRLPSPCLPVRPSPHCFPFRNPQSRELSLSVFNFVLDEQVLAPFGARLRVVAEEHVVEADAQRLL